MDMKKRIHLELRNRTPSDVSNAKKKKLIIKIHPTFFFWGGEEGASQPRGVRGAAAAAGPLLPLRCLPVCVCLCVCVCVCVCACGAVHPNLGVPEGARVMV